MIYVTAGLFGEFEKYEKALKKIEFSDEDSLFVLGNILDYGDRGMDILLDMMYRVNVYPILGEHDHMAKKYLTALHEGLNGTSMAEFEAAAPGVVDWISKQGGQATVEDFMKLEKSQKEQIVEFLADFELYDQLSVGDKEYIFVHGGIAEFDPEKEMDEYTLEELVYSDCDFKKVYFEDSILVTGKCHTYEIDGYEQHQIYHGNQHLAVHCGCEQDGFLGLICLDTGKEFYI